MVIYDSINSLNYKLCNMGCIQEFISIISQLQGMTTQLICENMSGTWLPLIPQSAMPIRTTTAPPFLFVLTRSPNKTKTIILLNTKMLSMLKTQYPAVWKRVINKKAIDKLIKLENRVEVQREVSTTFLLTLDLAKLAFIMSSMRLVLALSHPTNSAHRPYLDDLSDSGYSETNWRSVALRALQAFIFTGSRNCLTPLSDIPPWSKQFSYPVHLSLCKILNSFSHSTSESTLLKKEFNLSASSWRFIRLQMFCHMPLKTRNFLSFLRGINYCTINDELEIEMLKKDNPNRSMSIAGLFDKTFCSVGFIFMYPQPSITIVQMLPYDCDSGFGKKIIRPKIKHDFGENIDETVHFLLRMKSKAKLRQRVYKVDYLEIIVNIRHFGIGAYVIPNAIFYTTASTLVGCDHYSSRFSTQTSLLEAKHLQERFKKTVGVKLPIFEYLPNFVQMLREQSLDAVADIIAVWKSICDLFMESYFPLFFTPEEVYVLLTYKKLQEEHSFYASTRQLLPLFSAYEEKNIQIIIEYLNTKYFQYFGRRLNYFREPGHRQNLIDKYIAQGKLNEILLEIAENIYNMPKCERLVELALHIIHKHYTAETFKPNDKVLMYIIFALCQNPNSEQLASLMEFVSPKMDINAWKKFYPGKGTPLLGLAFILYQNPTAAPVEIARKIIADPKVCSDDLVSSSCNKNKPSPFTFLICALNRHTNNEDLITLVKEAIAKIDNPLIHWPTIIATKATLLEALVSILGHGHIGKEIDEVAHYLERFPYQNAFADKASLLQNFVHALENNAENKQLQLDVIEVAQTLTHNAWEQAIVRQSTNALMMLMHSLEKHPCNDNLMLMVNSTIKLFRKSVNVWGARTLTGDTAFMMLIRALYKNPSNDKFHSIVDSVSFLSDYIPAVFWNIALKDNNNTPLMQLMLTLSNNSDNVALIRVVEKVVEVVARKPNFWGIALTGNKDFPLLQLVVALSKNPQSENLLSIIIKIIAATTRHRNLWHQSNNQGQTPFSILKFTLEKNPSNAELRKRVQELAPFHCVDHNMVKHTRLVAIG
jgi:hypothetical protein